MKIMVKRAMRINSIDNGNTPSFMEIVVDILIATLPIAYIVKGGREGTIFTDFTAIIFYFAIFLMITMLTVGKTKFELTQFDFSILLFAFWILLGILYSPYEELGTVKFAKFLFFSVSIIYIVRVLAKKAGKQIDRILEIYSIIITFISIRFIVFYYRAGLYGRVSYMQTNAVAFGYSIGFVIMYIIGKFFTTKERSIWYKVVLIIFLGVNLYALTLNATKGVLASVVITLILFAPFFYYRNKRLFYAVLFSFFIVAFLIFNINYNSIPILQRFFVINKDLSTVYRFELWNQAVQDFLKSPILGIGTGGFACTLGGIFQTGIYPHDIILEIGAENGAIGILLLSFIIYAVMKTYKKTKKSYQSILLMQLVVFSFLGNLVSYSYAINKNLYFSVGLLITNLILDKKETKRNDKSSIIN